MVRATVYLSQPNRQKRAHRYQHIGRPKRLGRHISPQHPPRDACVRTEICNHPQGYGAMSGNLATWMCGRGKANPGLGSSTDPKKWSTFRTNASRSGS